MTVGDKTDNSSTARVGVAFTVGSGVKLFRAQFTRVGGGTDNFHFGGLMVRRRYNANLIVDGAITADHLAVNSVTAAKIAAGTITGSKLDVGTITADKITVGTLVATNMAANAVTRNYSVFSSSNQAINSAWETIASVAVTSDSSDIINVFVGADYASNVTVVDGQPANSVTYRLLRDTTVLVSFDGAEYGNVIRVGDNQNSASSMGVLARFYRYTGYSGTETFFLQAMRNTGSGDVNVRNRGIFATVYRR